MSVEAFSSKETEEQYSGGLCRSLLLFGPRREDTPNTEQRPLAIVHDYDGEFNTVWSTWMHQEEVQSVLSEISGRPRNPIRRRGVSLFLGTLGGDEICYENLGGVYAPRVGIQSTHPQVRVIAQLMVATAVSRGLDVEIVSRVMGDFIDRQRAIRPR